MLFSHIFILSAHIKYPSIKPIVSLFVITAAAQEDENPSSFAKLVAEFPENIKLEEEGRPLECCAMWWLRVRLCTAAGKKEFPLEKFLGIDCADICTQGQVSQLDKLESVRYAVLRKDRFISWPLLKACQPIPKMYGFWSQREAKRGISFWLFLTPLPASGS